MNNEARQHIISIFIIILLILSVFSSFYGFPIQQAKADAIPPTIVINFAGNLSDSGGPHWRPPGESDILDEAGEGDWRDGYYTNNSRQSEGWMYINLTVEDDDGVPNVWLQWKNESTWTNYTYPFLNTSGGYFEFNTSGNLSTFEGYNYSFNIVANDTGGNSKNVWWNKTGLGGSYNRRHVQLNSTAVNISYVIPFYFYDANITVVGDGGKHDRLEKDQGSAGGNDTGYLSSNPLTDDVSNVSCVFSIGYFFNADMCIEPITTKNIYFHFWWNSTSDDLNAGGLGEEREYWQTFSMDYDYHIYESNNRSTIIYGEKEYYLETYKLVTSPGYSFSDNDIYEAFVAVIESSHHPNIISNISFASFVLFNVPDDETLNASYADSDNDGLSDWTELYVNYTNPFLSDTDNDGMSDYYETLYGSDPNNWYDTAIQTQSGEAPTNESIDNNLVPNLYVICADKDSNAMNATWRSNSTDGDTWVDFAINANIANNTNITQQNLNFTSIDTTYWWSVNLTDGTDWTNNTYNFTTSSGCAVCTDFEIADPIESYNFEDTICINNLVIEDEYVVFNSTGYNISAPSNILITLRNINGSTDGGTENDELLEFEVYIVSGSTTISISGFKENIIHNIYKDSVFDSSFLSNSTGCINITIDSGVSYIYTVDVGGNTAPTISNPSPVDTATGVSLSPTLSADIADPNGNTMDWYIRTNDGSDWDTIDSDTGASNSTISTVTTGRFINYSTLSTWSINITDGSSWTNQTFTFTTLANTAPTISSPSPNNGATGVSVSLSSLSVTIADSENTFNWTITTSPNIGTSNANGASDGSKTCSISGLSYDGYYTWTVSVTDATSWTNTTYDFTVESDPGGGPPINSAPTVSNPYPADGASIAFITPICHVLVADANLDSIDVNFYWRNETDVYVVMQNNASVASGNIVYWNFTNASSYNTLYYWRVTVDDGTVNITYSYNFTTYPNNPVVLYTSPVNGAVNIIRNTTVSVTVFDYQGDSMNVTWRSNSSGSWVDFGYNGSVGNGTYSQKFSNASDYNTRYWWSVNISGSWTNETFSFTTEINIAPSIIDPIPRNGRWISIYMTNLSVVISDANSLFNYTIETDPNIGSSSGNDETDGVKGVTVSSLNHSTTYTWYVNATDGQSWTNVSYHFTTKSSTDFDIYEFLNNPIAFATEPFRVYVSDFFWAFIIVGMIGLVYAASGNVGSTLVAILLMFAAYGGKRVFVDGMGQQVSLLFSVIAALCLTVLILGLFLSKRNR